MMTSVRAELVGGAGVFNATKLDEGCRTVTAAADGQSYPYLDVARVAHILQHLQRVPAAVVKGCSRREQADVSEHSGVAHKVG